MGGLITTSNQVGDAVANATAINASLALGGDWTIQGYVPIGGTIMNGALFGARLFGGGSWGSSIRQQLGGTCLHWVGPTGLPMYVHQPDFGGGVFGVLFKGNSAQPPLCAMMLDTGKYSIASGGFTNPTENRNCTEGTFDQIWIGQTFGLDTDAVAGQFQNGILFTGRINGDAHKFGQVMVMGVSATAIWNQNPNAAQISWDTLTIKASRNCIDTTAAMVIRNLYCTSSDYNMILRDNGSLSIDSMFTENGGGLFTFLPGTLSGYNINELQKVFIRNGVFGMLPTGNTPRIIDVTNSKLWVIRMDAFNFQTSLVNSQVPLVNLAHPDGNVYGSYDIQTFSAFYDMGSANFITGAPKYKKPYRVKSADLAS